MRTYPNVLYGEIATMSNGKTNDQILWIWWTTKEGGLSQYDVAMAIHSPL